MAALRMLMDDEKALDALPLVLVLVTWPPVERPRLPEPDLNAARVPNLEEAPTWEDAEWQ